MQRPELAPDPVATIGVSFWDLLDRERKLIGCLATPPGMIVHAFVGEHLYTSLPHSDGQRYIYRFGITGEF